MARLITLFLYFLLLTLHINAQGINTSKLDSLFDTLSKNYLTMGSITIAQHGKTIYKRAIGFVIRKDGSNVPANTETEYRIGKRLWHGDVSFFICWKKRIWA